MNKTCKCCGNEGETETKEFLCHNCVEETIETELGPVCVKCGEMPHLQLDEDEEVGALSLETIGVTQPPPVDAIPPNDLAEANFAKVKNLFESGFKGEAIYGPMQSAVIKTGGIGLTVCVQLKPSPYVLIKVDAECHNDGRILVETLGYIGEPISEERQLLYDTGEPVFVKAYGHARWFNTPTNDLSELPGVIDDIKSYMESVFFDSISGVPLEIALTPPTFIHLTPEPEDAKTRNKQSSRRRS